GGGLAGTHSPGTVNVAPTEVALTPSDRAILPSTTTSGWSSPWIVVLSWISCEVTMQSPLGAGSLSSRPMIVPPVELALGSSPQPHLFGMLVSRPAQLGCVALPVPQQSRAMIGPSWFAIAGITFMLMS